MSVGTPEAPVPEAAPFVCPHCHELIAEDQEWCLECGAAARTVIASTPRWGMPIALIAVIATLSLLALAIAFVALADTDDDVRTAQQSAPAATTATSAATPASTAGTAAIPTG